MEKWESVHLQFQCIHVMLLKKEFPMGHRFECEDISFAFMLMVSSVLIMMGLLGWIIRIADVTDVHPENNILVLSGFLRRDTSGFFAHCQDGFFSLLILLVSWVWFVITKQTKRTSLFHDMFFLFLTEHDNVFLSETSLKLKEYRVCSLAPTSLLSLK